MAKGDFSFQLMFTCEYHNRIAVGTVQFHLSVSWQNLQDITLLQMSLDKLGSHLTRRIS